MTGAYVDKGYVYAVARIRYAELKLLNAQALSQLLQTADCADAVKFLKEKGWGKDGSDTPESLLRDERSRLWDFIDEIVPDRSVFDVFKLPNDYNNLKAAIKESVLESGFPDIYIQEYTVDPELIREAVRERSYGDLPPVMAEAAEKAQQEFLKSRDGQLCDVICDRACLEAVIGAAELSGEEFLKVYAETFVSSVNIRIAVRAALAGKNRDFLELAVAECDSLDRKGLINAAVSGVDAIGSFLGNTAYAEAVNVIKESPAAFECWCDDLVTERSKDQLMESFGIGPIAAYILAKENEIKSVRILLSGKLNGLLEERIAERMRKPYV